MVNCPNCGYRDPFLTSWFDPEKQVCNHEYAEEWDPQLWLELQEGDVRRTEKDSKEYVYHKTPKSVERWLAWNWDNRKTRPKGYYDTTNSRRKNYHIIGRRLAKQEEEKRKNQRKLVLVHEV